MPSKSARFSWDRVQHGSPGACWPWQGCVNRWGYGDCQLDGVRMNASRAAWIETHGQPAPGRVVCHRCDNPICCNPRHLFLGTQADNLADCRQKGRSRCRSGASHHRATAKITEAEVSTIRALVASGLSQSEVGRRVGIHSSTICRIVNRKSWPHT